MEVLLKSLIQTYSSQAWERVSQYSSLIVVRSDDRGTSTPNKCLGNQIFEPLNNDSFEHPSMGVFQPSAYVLSLLTKHLNSGLAY